MQPYFINGENLDLNYSYYSTTIPQFEIIYPDGRNILFRMASKAFG